VADNSTNRRILETQLQNWGMKTVSAQSGEEALKLALESFNIALLDLQMPDMDGISLAREMRRHNPTPLILLSSSGEILTGEESTLFQFQIPKPIKHSLLYNALMRITGYATTQKPKPPENKWDPGMAAAHPLRILLAEDNAVNQKVGALMLWRLGYAVDLADNGLLAVEAAQKTAYDLVLMDIQMPEMNGLDAARIIRKRLGPRCPAIIALTAEALEGDKERFIRAGFDDYLSKPLQAPQLQTVLKNVNSPAQNSIPYSKL
jgi:CheY-like chemotaxis protein